MPDKEIGSGEEFSTIPGWTAEMERLFRKRIQEHTKSMLTGKLARIVRTAIVNPKFRRALESDPAGMMKEYGLQPKADTIIRVPEDRRVFPIIIPKVVSPPPRPRPQPTPPGPRPGPDPLPGEPGLPVKPVPPGGIDVGDGDLFS